MRRSKLANVAPRRFARGSRTVWYSYAVIRVVPRVERGEFLNVGIVLFSRDYPYLAARIELDPQRLRALRSDVDVEAVARHLLTFQAICEGDPAGGPVAELPPADRFYWLVAPRSTIIETSPVHVGRAADPDQALEELMNRLVRQPAISDQGRAPP